LLLTEAVRAILVIIPEVAILNTAQWIALWVNGPVGLRALRPAVVVPDITLVQSLLMPVMVAKLVLQPAKLKIAARFIVQLIALWVTGVLGVRALSAAVVVPDITLARSLLAPLMVAKLVL